MFKALERYALNISLNNLYLNSKGLMLFACTVPSHHNIAVLLDTETHPCAYISNINK